MKNKFIKLAVLALTLVATSIAMLLPSMAAEEQFSGFTHLDYLTAPAEQLQIIESEAFAFDRLSLTPTGADGRTFAIANPTSLVLDSGCYMVSLALSGSNLPEIRLLWRFGGYSDAAFVIKNDKLKLAWTDRVIADLSSIDTVYLTYFVDIVNFKMYYSVYSTAWAQPTQYEEYDLLETANTASLTQNRYLYLYVTPSADKQGTLFIEEMTLTELSPVVLNAFTAHDSGYQTGFEAGLTEGYQHGYIDGDEIGYNRGYEEGEQNGFNAGYDEGYFDGYNDGWDNGISEGMDSGYFEGFAAGKEEGISEGKEEGYDEGYTSGYNQGNYDGALEGYANGRTDGLAEGYGQGYDQGSSDGYILGYGEGELVGYNQGIQDSNFVFDAVNGVWHGAIEAYETLADGISIFNVSLGSVVTTAGIVLLVTFVVKVVRGS